MKRIKNFLFNDIVLYCKGWLHRDEDTLEDLQFLFNQIYGHVDKNEEAIAYKMLRVLDSLYEELELPQNCSHRWLRTHTSFEEEVRKNMWIYNVSRDMAIIKTVRSILLDLSKDEIKLNPLHYGKHEHFRMEQQNGGAPMSMTYTEMNSIAKRVFNYD